MSYWPPAMKYANDYTILGEMLGLFEAWTGIQDYSLSQIDHTWSRLQTHQQIHLVALLERLNPQFIKEIIIWEIEEAQAAEVPFGEKIVGRNNWGFLLYTILAETGVQSSILPELPEFDHKSRYGLDPLSQ